MADLKILFFVLLFLCCSVSGGKPEFLDSEYLNIPASEFVDSGKTTIGIVQQVMSMVSEFYGAIGDFRLSNAIADCLDLMDLSVDQLSWTLYASQNLQGNDRGTGNVIADMKSWLSAAMTNQETCREGFDGTNTILKDLIAGTLDQASSSVYDMLAAVNPPPPATPSKNNAAAAGHPSFRKLIPGDQFPEWLKPHDRKLLQSTNAMNAEAVVAADGSGTYTSIEAAIKAAPEFNSKRYVIYIKRGVYREYVEIGKKKWNIMLIGDGMDSTIVSGNRSCADGWTTYRSATFAVAGQRFIARDMTFENTAGPEKHQAVAFRSDSDLSVCYRCCIRGYQDTLYVHSNRQFYGECKIMGTVDFLFGNGKAVFQNCLIQARKGLSNQKNTITAQGRNESIQTTGFSIQFCNITVEPGVPNSTQTYLGRPWRLYSRTVVMQSYISNAIRPEGWLEWNETSPLDKLFYGEYMNYGPGAGLGARVKWPGYHVLNSSAQANSFTVAQFIIGNEWLPSTEISYTAGLGL